MFKKVIFFPLHVVGWTYGLIPQVKLGTLFGIPLILSRAYIFWMLLMGLMGGWGLVAIIALAYFFVVIHEYSHAIVASKLGYKVVSITLWPMSGLATIDGNFDETYKHELWIALAGPLSNILLAAIIFPFAAQNSWTVAAFEINVYLALFNMVPITPMDGGRVFHALLLSEFKDVVRTAKVTTVLTAIVGAIILPVLYLYWSPLAAFMVAFMVFIGISEQRNKIDKVKLDKVVARMLEIVEKTVEYEGKEEVFAETLNEAKSFYLEGLYSKAKEKCDEIMFSPKLCQPSENSGTTSEIVV